MKFTKTLASLLLLLISQPVLAAPYQGDLIDAQSSIDAEMEDLSIVIRLMDKGGVKKTIISSKGSKMVKHQAAFVELHPDRLVSALKSTNRHYREDDLDALEKKIGKWMRKYQFGAIADLNLYSKKGSAYKASLDSLAVRLDEPRVERYLELARENQWPFVLRAFFSEMTKEVRAQYLSDLSALLDRNPGTKFVLSHLGQLKHKEITVLLNKHDNIFFDLSRTNPIYSESEQKYTMIFHPVVLQVSDKDGLKIEWRETFNQHADRFIAGFYNVGVLDWEESLYLEQVAWMRKALGELETAAAEKIAYKNAERLWSLK